MTDNAETTDAVVNEERTQNQGDSATVQPENENNSGLASHEPTVESLMAENDDLRAIIVDLEAQLAAANAKADKAEKKATSAKAGPKPVKARKCKPITDAPDAQNLLELIAAADTVEIVFSDGKTEQTALAPLSVEGGSEAWKVKSDGRLALALANVVISPVGSATVAGYGLFLDGDQVAWSSRMDSLTIGNGQKIEITDDVLF